MSCKNWYDYIILVSCYTHPTDRVSLQPFNFFLIHPSAYITQTQYAGINQIENYNYMDVSFNFAVCNYLPPFTVRTTYQAINNYRNIDLI